MSAFKKNCQHILKLRHAGLLAVLVLRLLIGDARAANVLVSWSANVEPDLAGYRVYHGTAPATYGTPMDAGLQPSLLVTGLGAGTHYFAVVAYDTSSNVSGFSAEASITIVEEPPNPPTGNVTVTFDNPSPPGSSGSYLSGLFGGINWGTNRWRWEGSYLSDPTNHIYFASNSGNSRTLTFSGGAKRLVKMRVFTGVSGTLTLSDNLGQTKVQSVGTGAMRTVTTNWSQPSATVTVKFNRGWELGVDDIEYAP